ncbi:hypothetical protein CPT_Sitrop_071 [Streptomyces phage Sitrop]|uniref:Uncharacterized protein n=1 Tax=Streptomyces phage Sitrop TaxID=2767587 RepID=A0A873WPI8_9CAUD|nr:hypothetical protein KGG96_gp68 [Streptomyces phage Sitrop]QPB09985.1 hypothetical protein CPT_Sitrop_071 [Streptomyces phage Sitrop]
MGYPRARVMRSSPGRSAWQAGKGPGNPWEALRSALRDARIHVLTCEDRPGLDIGVTVSARCDQNEARRTSRKAQRSSVASQGPTGLGKSAKFNLHTERNSCRVELSKTAGPSSTDHRLGANEADVNPTVRSQSQAKRKLHSPESSGRVRPARQQEASTIGRKHKLHTDREAGRVGPRENGSGGTARAKYERSPSTLRTQQSASDTEKCLP